MNDPDMTPAVRRRTLAAVIACISVYGITVGLSTPLLSLILESRDTTPALIGLNAATSAISTLVVAPFIPSLTRKLGVKALLFLAIITDVALLLMLPTFQSLAAWFAIRFAMGATVTSLFVVSETWINELAEEHNRGRIMAIYNATLAGSFALGPLVIPITGIEGWPPFLVGAGFIALAAFPLALVDNEPSSIKGRSSFGVLKFMRLAPTMTGAALLTAFVYAGTSAFLAVYGVQHAMSEDAAAVMLTALGLGGIVLQYPIGFLADRMNRYLILILCAGLSGVASFALPVVIDYPMLLWAVLFLWGGWMSGVYTVTMTITGQRFRSMELATAMAAFGVLWGVGSLIGPAVLGAGMELWGPYGMPAMLFTSNLAFVVLAIWRRVARSEGGD